MEQDNGEAYASPTLDQLLNPSAPEAPTHAEAGQPSAPPEPAPQETKGETAPEATDAGPPRDDAGRFAPKQPKEPETAAPPAAETEPKHVPVAALKDERAKRQQAEQQLASLQAQVAAWQRQQQQPPAQPQQPASDPIGALLDNPQDFVARQVQQAVAPLAEQAVQQRLALSREFVASQASDYAQAEQALAEFVQANPQYGAHVAQTLRSHPNPAKWALEQGRALIRQRQWAPVIQAHASPDEFVAQRAPQSPPPAPPAPSNPLPASLATARASSARTTGDTSGRSLDELVRFKG